MKMSLNTRCFLKAEDSLIISIRVGNENPDNLHSLCMSCMLFLLVQLPLSCDVIECKLLESHSPDVYAIMMEA